MSASLPLTAWPLADVLAEVEHLAKCDTRPRCDAVVHTWTRDDWRDLAHRLAAAVREMTDASHAVEPRHVLMRVASALAVASYVFVVLLVGPRDLTALDPNEIRRALHLESVR